MINELKLDDDRVKKMKFTRVHRLGGLQKKTQHSRPIIIRFQDYVDKSTVWEARNKISDSSLFISENFSAETEFNRKKIYIIYKYAKSLEKYKTKISLTGDTLIIDSIRYTVDNLNALPADLSPRHFCEKSSGIFFGFRRDCE